MFKYLIFFLNSIAALALLVLLALSYLPPSSVPLIPSVTLLTPVLLVVNGMFFLYWIINLNKKSLLSFITLLICIPFVSSFFQFNFEKEIGETKKIKIKIVDFNAHGFSSIDTGGSFKKKFLELVKKEDPDIMFFQEIYLDDLVEDNLNSYKYREATVTKGIEQGANPILSKYPIIAHGSVGMDNVHIGRNTLFADIKIGTDTIRCYNLHLTSYRLRKNAEALKEKGIKTIVTKLNTVFKYQEQQVNKITKHIEKSPYPIIFCGDFNNMAFSYVYRQIKKAGNLKDSFIEKGNGFGATHDFKYFPTRIDFTLVSDHIKVNSHKVIKTKDWSDHYPVITRLSF